ncbi:MAG: hypothetical protein K2H60_04810 [Muribaculaceae bacterium]|nr:hypothetical protein [Muribaculaceae bacterium]
METFEDILGKVLQECEGLDEKEIDAVLSRLLKEEGLNEEEMNFANETFSLLEKSQEKYESLQKARKQGDTRQEWLAAEFDKMLEGRSEEEVVAVMKALEEGTEVDVEAELESLEKDLESKGTDVGSENKEEE